MNCIRDGKYTGDSCFGCPVKVDECEIRDKVYRKRWIPVEERLPEEGVNPVTHDSYVYPVTVDFGDAQDVRYYSFCCGHWYNQGLGEMDNWVIAWMPRQEPYRPKKLRFRRSR